MDWEYQVDARGLGGGAINRRRRIDIGLPIVGWAIPVPFTVLAMPAIVVSAVAPSIVPVTVVSAIVPVAVISAVAPSIVPVPLMIMVIG